MKDVTDVEHDFDTSTQSTCSDFEGAVTPPAALVEDQASQLQQSLSTPLVQPAGVQPNGPVKAGIVLQPPPVQPQLPWASRDGDVCSQTGSSKACEEYCEPSHEQLAWTMPSWHEQSWQQEWYWMQPNQSSFPVSFALPHMQPVHQQLHATQPHPCPEQFHQAQFSCQPNRPVLACPPSHLPLSQQQHQQHQQHQQQQRQRQQQPDREGSLAGAADHFAHGGGALYGDFGVGGDEMDDFVADDGDADQDLEDLLRDF